MALEIAKHCLSPPDIVPTACDGSLTSIPICAIFSDAILFALLTSKVLKEAGFKNVELFDTTFYKSPEETRAMKTDKSRYEAREKMGQVQPFNY